MPEDSLTTVNPPSPLAARVSAADVLAVPRGKLAGALARAIAACQSVPKDDRNEYHRYQYASADRIIAEGRKALAAAELALVPMEASLHGSDRSGQDRFELARTFVLIHSSGESIPLRVVWPVCVEKGRPLDKATAAADTLSLSYLLRDLLLMDRVDPSDDVSHREDRPQQQPAPQQRPKRRPPADGAELEQRLKDRERGLVEKGLCRTGELLDWVRGQARALMPDGQVPPIPNWGRDLLDRAAEWVTAFLRSHAPAPMQTTPASPPPPAPAAPSAELLAEVRKLYPTIWRRGDADATAWMELPAGTPLEKAPAGEIQRLIAALREQAVIDAAKK
jgi:hypothetical protein